MLISTKRIVTILNVKGESRIDANQFYDNSTRVKSLEAVIYNQFGNEIKRFKKKDFNFMMS
ncbi:hypothetical protein [Flavobacterium sp. GT3R68]|uniref:hypothetical protein n=1 Tax=Flavobacterium sp. GT3R68 TaxID=2594437 RepID=UPI000F88BE2D|nr:hypothetical protein [Flavobacterium sp. GT3R68]RTY92499.1 hypothetical protein EKL32_16985 [Flavobacterium sp. GSN2]TRW94125.1 hypothetical protein FNW07_04200 [Flavobacterium sp. GT3R68]